MQVHEISKSVQMNVVLEKDVDFSEEDLISSFNPTLKQFRQSSINRIANLHGYEYGECLGYVSGNFVNATFIKHLRDEDDGMARLQMLTADEVAVKINSTRQHVLVLKDIGILKSIKTGKNYMFSQKEVQRFEDDYAGYDVSNRMKALNAYKEKVTVTAVTK